MKNYCDNCALRLFNNKHYNLQGIGNPYFGNCIVVPNVDYNAYKTGTMGFSKQVEIINSIIPSTGGVERVFILPLIRCSDKLGCELTTDIYNNCIHYFARDINKYQFKRILLLGDAAKRFFNCNVSDYIDTIIISRNNRIYNVNYSPFIIYTNKDKYEIFKRYLLKWYNSISNNDFTQYKILRL